MIWNLGEDGVDEAHVVHTLGEVWKDLADFFPALAIFLERKRRLHQRAGLALMLKITTRHRLAVVLFENGLVIEAVDLREPTIHEKKDDVLGTRLEPRILDHP